MKRLLPLLLLFALLLPLTSHAQGNTNIDRIEVSLWPDFDDASLLVLVTGTMPANAALPTEITFPLPNGYDRLVVARITADGNLIDDIETVKTTNSVIFSSPESRFRIEYYLPYTANGDQRQIDFFWMSPNLDVATFQVAVQEPAMATELTISPDPIGEMVGNITGLTEHVLPEVALPADTVYEATAEYVANGRLLSIDLINDNSQPATDNGITVLPAANTNNPLILVFGIIGVLLIATAVGWYIITSRQNNKPPQKPKPVRTKQKPSTAASFCHECGSPLAAGAKFCASCGTAVKK